MKHRSRTGAYILTLIGVDQRDRLLLPVARHGHIPGRVQVQTGERNPNFPFTLDRRR